MLEHVEFGYAITIHESQCSQRRRVIVVITGNRLLDPTLIYTAITLAQSQFTIIEDVLAARRAVEAPLRADGRQVAIGDLLTRCVSLDSCGA